MPPYSTVAADAPAAERGSSNVGNEVRRGADDVQDVGDVARELRAFEEQRLPDLVRAEDLAARQAPAACANASLAMSTSMSRSATSGSLHGELHLLQARRCPARSSSGIAFSISSAFLPSCRS